VSVLQGHTTAAPSFQRPEFFPGVPGASTREQTQAFRPPITRVRFFSSNREGVHRFFGPLEFLPTSDLGNSTSPTFLFPSIDIPVGGDDFAAFGNSGIGVRPLPSARKTRSMNFFFPFRRSGTFPVARSTRSNERPRKKLPREELEPNSPEFAERWPSSSRNPNCLESAPTSDPHYGPSPPHRGRKPIRFRPGSVAKTIAFAGPQPSCGKALAKALAAGGGERIAGTPHFPAKAAACWRALAKPSGPERSP